MSIVYILIGGFFGGLSRFFLSTWLNRFQLNGFPIGTLTVNCLGAALLGVVLSYGIIFEVRFDREALLEIGFLGGMTTFSSYSLDCYDLIQKNKFGQALVYLIGSPIFGIIGFWAVLVLHGGVFK
ncbi:MAG: fluoride efflux transporter CrcB [Coraliomargaritaceae bacterium]